MDEVAILGVGMHPWGKWGRNFTEYGVHAAREALADAAVDWRDVGFVSGAITVRCGYPGYVSGSTFARALGFTGAQVASSYAACASGVTALSVARGQILSGACDVALVVGVDTTPKGFLAPAEGDRPDDTAWLRFHMVGATNPVYFALHARRRMALHGATPEDFAMVKAKNSRHGVHNPNARYPKEDGIQDVANSPVVSDPLRLLEICATSDGGAALVVSSMDYARSMGVMDPVRVAGRSTVTWSMVNSPSPVGSGGLMVTSERLTTRPVTVSTLSTRTASMVGNSALETSMTHWVRPNASRRSTNIRLPWSRLEWTQPDSRTSLPSSPRHNSPQLWVR